MLCHTDTMIHMLCHDRGSGWRRTKHAFGGQESNDISGASLVPPPLSQPQDADLGRKPLGCWLKPNANLSVPLHVCVCAVACVRVCVHTYPHARVHTYMIIITCTLTLRDGRGRLCDLYVRALVRPDSTNTCALSLAHTHTLGDLHE